VGTGSVRRSITAITVRILGFLILGDALR
jgi:hypothetical protein